MSYIRRPPTKIDTYAMHTAAATPRYKLTHMELYASRRSPIEINAYGAAYSLPSEEKGCHNDKNIVALAEN